MQITLIRHTTPEVPVGTCYGQTDVPLRSTFTEEAELVRSRLVGIPFDAAYTSPLSRCTCLADYCGYPDARRDSRLLEINFGEWEMQRYDRIVDPRLQEYYADYIHTAATGGESFAIQLERVSNFLHELASQPLRHVALFTHGGTILCTQVYAGIYSLAECFEHQTPYGGIVTLQIGTKK